MRFGSLRRLLRLWFAGRLVAVARVFGGWGLRAVDPLVVPAADAARVKELNAAASAFLAVYVVDHSLAELHDVIERFSAAVAVVGR